jgi:hypothetical protein
MDRETYTRAYTFELTLMTISRQRTPLARLMNYRKTMMVRKPKHGSLRIQIRIHAHLLREPQRGPKIRMKRDAPLLEHLV